MDSTTGDKIKPENHGDLKVSDDVIAIIAAISAVDVNGVAGLSGSTAGSGITEILSRKNLAKGIKVIVNEGKITLDLYVIVEYGSRIPDVAWQVQDKVKKTIESLVGLKVVEVNIHVLGIAAAGTAAPPDEQDRQTGTEET